VPSQWKVVAGVCALLCLSGARFAAESSWTSTDVGNVAIAGSASESNGTWTVSGSGADIWGSEDSFQFVHQSSDDSSIVDAVVHPPQNTNTFAKAGVMVRSSLDANAATAILDLRPSGALEFMVRDADGAQMQFIRGFESSGCPSSQPCGIFLRLIWSAGVVTAYFKHDFPDNWLPLASAAIALPSSTQAGVAVTSHDQTQLTTAVFEGLNLSRQAVPGWSSVDVGAVGQMGSASEANAVWTISGSGGDIWGAADAFHFVYRGATPNMQSLRIRIDDMQNTNAFAKAGIMVRSGLDPDDAAVILDVTPSGNVEFMARSTKGGEMQYIGGATVHFPVWLQFSNAAYPEKVDLAPTVSQDGVHWTRVADRTALLPATSAYYAGPVVTSHDTSVLNTVHVEGLTLVGSGQVADVNTGGVLTTAAVDLLQPNHPLTIEAAGSDIWGTADSFGYLWSPAPNGIAFAVRVAALKAANPFAKAGLMVRDGVEAGAPSAILDAKPDGGVEFMARLCAGCETTFIAGGQITFPAFLVLTRNGSTITAAISQTDRAHATTIGSVEMPPMANPTIGYAVTSHVAGQAATAVFDTPPIQ